MTLTTEDWTSRTAEDIAFELAFAIIVILSLVAATITAIYFYNMYVTFTVGVIAFVVFLFIVGYLFDHPRTAKAFRYIGAVWYHYKQERFKERLHS